MYRHPEAMEVKLGLVQASSREIKSKCNMMEHDRNKDALNEGFLLQLGNQTNSHISHVLLHRFILFMMNESWPCVWVMQKLPLLQRVL